MDKDQQQQIKQKKYINKRQYKSKGLRFRKVDRRPNTSSTQTILNIINNPIKKCNTKQLLENKTLPIFLPFLLKKKWYPLKTETNTDLTLFLSDFSMVSNIAFKQMLLTFVTTTAATKPINIETNSLVNLFNDEEVLTFTRLLTQLINKKRFFQLQYDQWTYYYYYFGINEDIWTGRISKNRTIINSMSYTYGRSKVMIEQHRQKYQRELKKIENEINKHMKQIPLAILDVHKIIEMITNFINQDQYQLRIEFERRRNILKFDAQDYQLAQNFLKLTPRQTEIHSAKIIWKAIRDEQILRCELVIFKKWLLHKSSTLMTYSFQDLPLIQMNAIFTQLIFDRQSSLSGITEDTSSSISINHSIDEFADALITQTLFIADQLAHIATDEKNKLLLTRDTSKNLPLLDKIISIIEHGQMNMVERIQYNTQQKLKILLNDTNSENNLDQ